MKIFTLKNSNIKYSLFNEARIFKEIKPKETEYEKTQRLKIQSELHPKPNEPRDSSEGDEQVWEETTEKKEYPDIHEKDKN